MQFVYIFGIPSEAIQTIVTRYVGKFGGRKKEGMIKDLLLRSMTLMLMDKKCIQVVKLEICI